MSRMPSYFLISLSNKENLDLCIKYSLAGFPNTLSGLWTYLDIRNGDYVSFLYGAKAYNLYRVEKKEAIINAKNLPPWKPIEYRISGKTYYFPFRLALSLKRKFQESLVRLEFAYVAENLLLRGGYRKTHFQADQTTLQNVSQLGSTCSESQSLELTNYETFVPAFTKNRSLVSMPVIFPLQEIIFQAATRQLLGENDKLERFLKVVEISDLQSGNLEVLGEKALPEGHVDILIKEAIPIGLSRKIVLELKIGKAGDKEVEQLERYINELGNECVAGILIAGDFNRRVLQRNQVLMKSKVHLVKYRLDNFSLDQSYSFDEIKDMINFTLAGYGET